MRRRKNVIIAYNPHSPGFGASLGTAFVMGIIVLSLMWHFKKSFIEIIIFAYVIMAIGRAFFSSNKAGSRLKRGQ